MKKGAKFFVAVFGVLAVVMWGNHIASAAPGGVTINEFVANPMSGDTDWVELHNSTATALSLSGWYLRDTAASNMKTFTSADVIPAGGFLVVQVNTRLGNAGDTIMLYSSAGLEDSVVYPDNIPTPLVGMSAGRDTDGTGSFVIFDAPTKGSSNNPIVLPVPEYGEIRVHGVVEIYPDNFPNFKGGEPHQAGMLMRVYRTDGPEWELVNSGTTTGKVFGNSLRFTLETGEYAVCMQTIDGHDQTFAKTITGWLSAADTSTPNFSAEPDEYNYCVAVTVAKNAITSHVFGVISNPASADL